MTGINLVMVALIQRRVTLVVYFLFSFGELDIHATLSAT